MNPAEDGLPLPQRYWAILTLVIGMVVSVLDSSIANIALPTIARQIGASPAQSIWVINAYQLAVVVVAAAAGVARRHFRLPPDLCDRVCRVHRRGTGQRLVA